MSKETTGQGFRFTLNKLLSKLPSTVIRRGVLLAFGGVIYVKSHGPYV